jgi:hypothetical protein
VISSVGLEHYFDRVGVTGSNPVSPTKLTAFFAVLQHQRRFFYFKPILLCLFSIDCNSKCGQNSYLCVLILGN